MNHDLLQSQFDRLVQNYADQRLQKQLSGELGSLIAQRDVSGIRRFRVLAAKALRELTLEPLLSENLYGHVFGVLETMLDIAAVAEEYLHAQQLTFTFDGRMIRLLLPGEEPSNPANAVMTDRGPGEYVDDNPNPIIIETEKSQ